MKPLTARPAGASDSPFVAAAPVWALVRRRQSQWGYSDDDMATFLGLGQVIDVRGLMLRPTAERILRRLAAPAPATAGTRQALTNRPDRRSVPRCRPGGIRGSRAHPGRAERRSDSAGAMGDCLAVSTPAHRCASSEAPEADVG